MLGSSVPLLLQNEQGSQSSADDDNWELFKADDFRMYCMKVPTLASSRASILQVVVALSTWCLHGHPGIVCIAGAGRSRAQAVQAHENVMVTETMRPLLSPVWARACTANA